MTRVTAVRLVHARPANGLLGYVSCTFAGLRLDGLALRRTRAGRLAVSFPCRRDRRGRKHPIVRPRDVSLERAILAALRRQGALPRQELHERARAVTGSPRIKATSDQRSEYARPQLGGLHDRQRTSRGRVS